MPGQNIANTKAMGLIREIVLPLIVPVLVGLGSSVVGSMVSNAVLKERVSFIEAQTLKHETTIERDLGRYQAEVSNITRSIEEHERRIVRLEADTATLKSMLEEVRADVKTLLKAVR